MQSIRAHHSGGIRAEAGTRQAAEHNQILILLNLPFVARVKILAVFSTAQTAISLTPLQLFSFHYLRRTLLLALFPV